MHLVSAKSPSSSRVSYSKRNAMSGPRSNAHADVGAGDDVDVDAIVDAHAHTHLFPVCKPLAQTPAQNFSLAQIIPRCRPLINTLIIVRNILALLPLLFCLILLLPALLCILKLILTALFLPINLLLHL